MGFKNDEVLRLWYFESGGSGTGKSPEDRADLADATVFAAGAGEVVTDATFVVEEAVSGVTNLIVGDASDADGLIANADLTLGTPGAYQGGGAYVSSAHKYYGSETNIDVAVTGTISAGKGAIAVRGYRI